MKKTVGVIGGGQLARMMIVPALELGLEIKVFAESADASASMAATQIGDYTKIEEIRQFSQGVDVITFYHEHVPLEVLEQLEAAGVAVRPASSALRFAQNKIEMRKILGELGLPIPDWAEANTVEDIDRFLLKHQGIAIAKTPTGGYDGKGVRVIRSAEEISDWLQLGAVLLEQKVNFVRELASLCARRPSGDMRTWPVVETVQKDGVCSEVISPAKDLSEQSLHLASEIALKVAEGIGVTGMLAVELFETEAGELLINELAMRPHNSGHFSIEGSKTSQFEQHLRAVLDLPLGSTEPNAPYSVMINLLGVDSENDLVSRYPAALAAHPSAKFHTYGKSASAGRKMGHVTVVGSDLVKVVAEARAAAAVCLKA